MLLGRWSPSGKIGKPTDVHNAEKLWVEHSAISTQNTFSRDTKSTLVNMSVHSVAKNGTKKKHHEIKSFQ